MGSSLTDVSTTLGGTNEPSPSILKGLLKSGAALLAGRNQREVFQSIVEGIARLGFTRVRLYLISTDEQTLQCVAQLGMEEAFEGEKWTMVGDEHMAILFAAPRPHVFTAAPNHPDPHAERLGRIDNDQWVEAPLVLEGKVVGKVSADNGHKPLPASLDLDVLDLFAQQAAAALEKSRLLEEAHHRVSMFEKIRDVAKILEGDFDPLTVLNAIVKSAVELLGAKNGGIYEYLESEGILKVVAELNRPDLLGRTMAVGQGMAGRLVLGDQPYMIEDNYHTWPDHDPTCDCFGAVLEVRMRLRGKIFGVIYVDDEVGRKFTQHDADLLTMFTGHAAAALEKAELARARVEQTRERDERLARLQRLAPAMAEITADPDKPFQERLDLIAQRVAEILNAANCGIHLVKTEGFLSLMADYPVNPGGISLKDLKVTIGEGLTGYIAHTRAPFRDQGDGLIHHPQVKDKGTAERTCHSLLALPLVKDDPGQTLLGLVRVANKKGPDGRPHPNIGFSDLDLELLKLFAQAIVSAIAGAESLSYGKALLECSLDGIIAIDRFGKVTEFNAKAQKILGWTKEEVLWQPVQKLYAEGEAPRIGKLLHESPTGTTVNDVAEVVAKDGCHIPIRISANDLWDAAGGWVGSVGHFEDLRPEKKAERRRRLLTDAITTVAGAGDLTTALRHFVSRLVGDPAYSFGHALLLRQDHETFDIVAGYPGPEDGPGTVRWRSWAGRQTYMSKWLGFKEVLEAGKPKLLEARNETDQQILKQLTGFFGLQAKMRSWLIVPMTMDGIVGYIGLGEIDGPHPTPFDQDNIDLIATVSTQVSVLIGRMRLNTLAEERRKLAEERRKEIEDLSSAARAMAECANLKQLEVEILNQARSLCGADLASMVILDDSQGKLFKRDFVAEGFSDKIKQQFSRGELREHGSNQWIIRDKYVEVKNLWTDNRANLAEDTSEALHEAGVCSFQGALLEVDKRPVAVLYVSHKASYLDSEPFPRPRRFIENFASTAAMALKAALLTDKLQRAKGTFDALVSISALGDVNKTMDAVAEATRLLLECDIVCLYACSPGTLEATLLKMHGNWGDYPFRRVTPDSPVYAMLQLDGPYLAVDVPTDHFLKNRRFAVAERVQSCAAIPLRVANGTVGVLFANYRKPFRFTENDLAALRHIADQAAIAIHNAQLFEKAENQRHALHDLAGTLLSATTRKTALDGALGVIAEQLKVTASEIVLPDGHGHLRATAAWGWELRSEVLLGHGRGSFSGWIMERRHPVVVDLSETQPFHIVDHLKQMKVKSMMGVPLFKSGQGDPIGAVLVFSVLERFFSKDDEELLDLLAKETAIALERFDETDRTERLRDAAREVARIMVLGDRDLKETLDAVVEGTVARAGCDAVTLYACDPQTGRVDRPPSMRGVLDPGKLNVPANIIARDGLVSKTLNWNELKPIEDVSKHPDFAGKRFVRAEKIRSCLVVPLRVTENKVGVMFVNYRHPHHFDEEEMTDIGLLANQAAVAIWNTRLFNEREKMQATIAGQMNLTWLGMIDRTSRHRTQNFAATIRNEAEDLAEMLAPKPKKKPTARQRAIAQSLDTIRERANEILAQRLATSRLEGQEDRSVALFREVTQWADRRRNWETDPSVLRGPDLQDGSGPLVWISPLWLSRALEILVDNAMRAVENRATPVVSLSISQQGQSAVIEVKDNGSGIPKALVGKLFREAVPKDERSRGSGVGLLIVQTIAQRYRGEIRVAATGASGTTMELSLPLYDSVEEVGIGGGK
jgi:PAS domain S-box-containing protein